MKKYLFLFLSLFFISCEKDSNPLTPEIDSADLYKSWTNSREEQDINTNILIYRPSDYKEFPASWYREVLIFSKDKTCNYLVLAANDAHYFKKGKWSLIDSKENIVAIFDSAGTVYKKFHIKELEQDIFKFTLVE